MSLVVAERHCPECGKLLIYTNMNAFYRARKRNGFCKPCSKLGKRNPFYGKKFTKNQLEKISKANSGKNNPMYGTLGGMYGKKQSEFQKKNQSRYMKSRWAKVKGIDVKDLHKGWSRLKKYRRLVYSLTNKLPLYLLENYEKRGRAGMDGAYHLDHIISIHRGFHSGISAEEIASMDNVKFIPWLENQKKWYK